MNSNEQNQQMIRNTAVKVMGVLAKDAETKYEEDMIHDVVKVAANALIDLNRIATALEMLAQAAAVTAMQGGGKAGNSPIIQPGRK